MKKKGIILIICSLLFIISGIVLYKINYVNEKFDKIGDKIDNSKYEIFNYNRNTLKMDFVKSFDITKKNKLNFIVLDTNNYFIGPGSEYEKNYYADDAITKVKVIETNNKSEDFIEDKINSYKIAEIDKFNYIKGKKNIDNIEYSYLAIEYLEKKLAEDISPSYYEIIYLAIPLSENELVEIEYTLWNKKYSDNILDIIFENMSLEKGAANYTISRLENDMLIGTLTGNFFDEKKINYSINYKINSKKYYEVESNKNDELFTSFNSKENEDDNVSVSLFINENDYNLIGNIEENIKNKYSESNFENYNKSDIAINDKIFTLIEFSYVKGNKVFYECIYIDIVDDYCAYVIKINSTKDKKYIYDFTDYKIEKSITQ